MNTPSDTGNKQPLSACSQITIVTVRFKPEDEKRTQDFLQRYAARKRRALSRNIQFD